MSPTALTVGIMLILGLLAAGGIIIYSIVQKRQASIDSAWQADAEMHAKAQEPKAPPPKPAPPARPSPAAAPTEPSIIAQTDPPSSDWERVQQAYRTSPPELALVALADFIRTSPGSTFASTARQQMDECLDRLWWVRIKELCEKRSNLTTRLAEIDKQIAIVRANGAVEERINELQAERTPLAKEMAKIQDRLAEMKYKDPRTPDPYDESQLAQLRKSRDAATFKEWKEKTTSFVTKNRGKLPW